MLLTPPERPQGDAQRQLETLYGYLYRMVEQLNLATQETDRQLSEANGAVSSAASSAKSAAEAAAKQAAVNLKQLIIKNADIIRQELEALRVTLEGTYVAQSDFGTYIENLSNQISADPTGIDQYYSFISQIQASIDAEDALFREYITRTEGYIRTGIVDYDGVTPIFGVAVGQGLTVTEADGEQEISSNEFRSVFTAKKLSFFRGAQEVAYLSNDRLYITDITILRSVQFGQQDAEKWEIGFNDSGFYIRWIGY